MTEKNKSTKRPALELDKSKTNDKKNKTLIDDYGIMSVQQATAKKK